MFEGLFQPTHLILILVIVLIVFGPGKLPEIGGAVGKSLREFKRSSSESFDSDNKQSATATATATAEPQATSQNACPNCHAQNAAGNKFCGECGAKLG